MKIEMLERKHLLCGKYVVTAVTQELIFQCPVEEGPGRELKRHVHILSLSVSPLHFPHLRSFILFQAE